MWRFSNCCILRVCGGFGFVLLSVPLSLALYKINTGFIGRLMTWSYIQGFICPQSDSMNENVGPINWILYSHCLFCIERGIFWYISFDEPFKMNALLNAWKWVLKDLQLSTLPGCHGNVPSQSHLFRFSRSGAGGSGPRGQGTSRAILSKVSKSRRGVARWATVGRLKTRPICIERDWMRSLSARKLAVGRPAQS